MRFDNAIRNGPVVTATDTSLADVGVPARVVASGLLLGMLTFPNVPASAQKPSDTSEPPEMLVTEQGFLAINSPKGWVRADGPGLAYFIPKEERNGKPRVWIYISSAPVGPNEEAKDLKAYIESDIAGFKERFKSGLVQEEPPLNLPLAEIQAPVCTFQSGEKRNSLEQVIYVGEINRVLTLVLSAREKPAFEKALPAFQDFARSYRGSITPKSNPN